MARDEFGGSRRRQAERDAIEDAADCFREAALRSRTGGGSFGFGAVLEEGRLAARRAERFGEGYTFEGGSKRRR